MKYCIDIELTGYETVQVEATSQEEAEEKAIERFWEIYEKGKVKDLRMKSIKLNVLD